MNERTPTNVRTNVMCVANDSVARITFVITGQSTLVYKQAQHYLFIFYLKLMN